MAGDEGAEAEDSGALGGGSGMLPPTPIEMPPGRGSEMPMPTEPQAVSSAIVTAGSTQRNVFMV